MISQEHNTTPNLLSENSKIYLQETVRWTKFLAILGLIFIGLMFFASLFLWTSNTYGHMSLFAKVGVAWYLVFTLLMLSLYIYPVVQLLQFSVRVKKGLEQQNQLLVEAGFKAQKNMFRFMGILSIIALLLYLLIMLSSLYFAML